MDARDKIKRTGSVGGEKKGATPKTKSGREKENFRGRELELYREKMVGLGAGGDSRSKEAVGMMALHEALRNVCLSSDWTYSVFWTIRPRPCTPLLSTSSSL